MVKGYWGKRVIQGCSVATLRRGTCRGHCAWQKPPLTSALSVIYQRSEAWEGQDAQPDVSGSLGLGCCSPPAALLHLFLELDVHKSFCLKKYHELKRKNKRKECSRASFPEGYPSGPSRGSRQRLQGQVMGKIQELWTFNLSLQPVLWSADTLHLPSLVPWGPWFLGPGTGPCAHAGLSCMLWCPRAQAVEMCPSMGAEALSCQPCLCSLLSHLGSCRTPGQVGSFSAARPKTAMQPCAPARSKAELMCS